jgi:hypothetical protein
MFGITSTIAKKENSDRRDSVDLSTTPDSVVDLGQMRKLTTINAGYGEKTSSSMFRRKKKESATNNPYDLVVIGAGFSGAFTTAEACSELGSQAKIALIDSHGLLSPQSSSQNECFKMHTGLHYISDRTTAETCLRNSVEMADAFYEFILDKNNNNAPSRRGRHYLMSNSHPVSYVKSECENLRRLYADLLEKFPNARKAFGEPENFITYLSPQDYPYIASDIPFTNEEGIIESTHISIGIETPECQIDPNRFQEYFNTVFAQNQKKKILDLLYGRTVTQIHHAEDFVGYVVDTIHFDKNTEKFVQETLATKSIINCAWQNIDGIDSTLNFHHNDKRPSTIRAKLLVKAKMPPSLASMNTCIFSAGPHVSLTRIPSDITSAETDPIGNLLVTFEPETNLGHFPSGTPLYKIADERLRKLIARPTSSSDSSTKQIDLANIRQRIMDGAAKYVPDLKDATILGHGIGFVKIFADTTSGNRYLYESTSPIHQRREDGIQERSLCYISFSGMKMTYSFQAAQKVVGMQQQQLAIREILEYFLKEIMLRLGSFEGTQEYKIRSALRYSLREYLLNSLQKITEANSHSEDSENILRTWMRTINLDQIAQQYSEQLVKHSASICFK